MNRATSESFPLQHVDNKAYIQTPDSPNDAKSFLSTIPGGSPGRQSSYSLLKDEEDVPIAHPAHPASNVVTHRIRMWARLRSNYRRHRVFWSRVFYGFLTLIAAMAWAIGVWRWEEYYMAKQEVRSSISLDDEHFEHRIYIRSSVRSYIPENHTITVLFTPMIIDKKGDFVNSISGQLSIYTHHAAKLATRDPSKAAKNWINPQASPDTGELEEWEATIKVRPTYSYKIWDQPDNGYPFDKAREDYPFSATLNGTNVPVVVVYMVESVQNYFISIGPEWPQIEGCTSTNDTCYLPVTFTVERPGYVWFSAMVVLIVNWLVTIALCMLTGELVMARRVHVLKETDGLSVFFAALFTLPQIRGVLPGAPSPGCLFDLIGILPCIVLTSCCAFILTIWKVTRSKHFDGL